MGQPAYRNCRSCGKSSKEVGELSWTRLCEDCGERICAENAVGISEHRGPAFKRWRERMAASVGGVLLDDVTAPVQTQRHAD